MSSRLGQAPAFQAGFFIKVFGSRNCLTVRNIPEGAGLQRLGTALLQ